jgi:hypothetical protein
MNGLIILISISFVAYIVHKITKIKILKYILSPIVSVLYGYMLFFIGMSIDAVLYLLLAAAPVIIGVIYIIKHRYIKKN